MDKEARVKSTLEKFKELSLKEMLRAAKRENVEAYLLEMRIKEKYNKLKNE